MTGFGRECVKSDVIEMEKVVAIGVIVPFDIDMGGVLVVTNIGGGETAVNEHAGYIGVLGRIGSVELMGMIVEPGLELFLS